MDERRLLELAAKAAGIELGWDVSGAYLALPGISGSDVRWNPLTDDGDALRLAVKLHLEIDHNHPHDNDRWVMALENGKMVGPEEEIEDESQRCEATRRCIVRAAAAIGEQREGEHG